ncbi:MAG TPA: hypothetical protein PLL39_18340, partial [Rhodocyclaceae bacterium]|nr:hypothetical protein [Rhodocyclaceae bacterium]
MSPVQQAHGVALKLRCEAGEAGTRPVCGVGQGCDAPVRLDEIGMIPERSLHARAGGAGCQVTHGRPQQGRFD